MVAKPTLHGSADLLQELRLDVRDPTPSNAAPKATKVTRRGTDAVLDTDDCEIIVYGLFPDRA